MRPGNQYRVRSVNMKKLGFSSYADYLKSDLWQECRQKAFKRWGRLCACGKYATQVHHKKYDIKTLTGVHAGNLRPICGDCHHHIEFDENGEKTMPSKASERLKVIKKDRISQALARHAECAGEFYGSTKGIS